MVYRTCIFIMGGAFLYKVPCFYEPASMQPSKKRDSCQQGLWFPAAWTDNDMRAHCTPSAIAQAVQGLPPSRGCEHSQRDAMQEGVPFHVAVWAGHA